MKNGTPELKTAREWLEPLGLDRLKTDGVHLDVLCAAPRFSSSAKPAGQIFVYAGGEVLMTLQRYAEDSKGSVFPLRMSIAVVRDATEQSVWDVMHKQGKTPDYPRPSVFLRVALIG